MTLEPDVPPYRTRPPATIIPLATQEQRECIAELVTAWHQTEASPLYLATLKRAIGRTRIRTADEASTVIAILRKLVERHQGAPGNTGSMERDGSWAA